MLEDVALSLSGQRFSATYEIAGGEEAARDLAQALCVEQTVEFPSELLPQAIRDQVVGRIESFRAASGGWEVQVSYAEETVGGELPQFLNVLFGNISLMPGVRLTGFGLTPVLLQAFRGPRYGRQGLRDLLRVPKRPLLCTAIKPMGLPSAVLARLAGAFATGGIDIVKDDHGLADQAFAPWRERVRACAAAIGEANARSGRRTLYLPNLGGPVATVLERAHEAKEAGAGGFLVSPGLVGWDLMRTLAEDDSLGLPIMGHPALLGSFLTGSRCGISHGALLGQMMRLAGADAVVYPHHGGRFSFSREECLEIADATLKPMEGLRPAFPAPAGGMRLERVPELIETYGTDVILLIGGDLFRSEEGLEAASRTFLESVAI